MTSIDGKRTLRTVSGKTIDPFHLREEDVRLRDIAYGLSNICRYNGQVLQFVSVAEHSVILSLIVPLEHAPGALFHDACEAYFGDMPAPIKHTPEEAYRREAEHQATVVILRCFGLPDHLPTIVSTLDKQIRVFENEARGMAPEDLDGAPECFRVDRALVTPKGLSPRKARALFIERYLELCDPRW